MAWRTQGLNTFCMEVEISADLPAKSGPGEQTPTGLPQDKEPWQIRSWWVSCHPKSLRVTLSVPGRASVTGTPEPCWVLQKRNSSCGVSQTRVTKSKTQSHAQDV
ncbi:Solute Carrier Family 13 Member 3 [Manis pentadactyla]|nr:Solute Carrier Family 13 Member 3 [Manis pentadactyla]